MRCTRNVMFMSSYALFVYLDGAVFLICCSFKAYVLSYSIFPKRSLGTQYSDPNMRCAVLRAASSPRGTRRGCRTRGRGIFGCSTCRLLSGWRPQHTLLAWWSPAFSEASAAFYRAPAKPALRAFFVGRSTTTNLDAINDLARSVVYM